MQQYLRTARTSKSSAAKMMNILHKGQGKLNRRHVFGRVGVQASVAKANAIDFIDFIVELQLKECAANDVIETRADATTSNNSSNGVWGIEENVLAWTSQFKLGTLLA